jgi:hypothetical protein
MKISPGKWSTSSNKHQSTTRQLLQGSALTELNFFQANNLRM